VRATRIAKAAHLPFKPAGRLVAVLGTVAHARSRLDENVLHMSKLRNVSLRRRIAAQLPETPEVTDPLTHRRGQTLLERALKRRELLFGKLQARALALKPFAQLLGQRCAVMTGQLASCEPPGERPVVDLVLATERDEQLAHALAVLQHFLVQLSAIADQLAGCLVLRGRRTYDAHAVALAVQPSTQVSDQPDRINPVCLRAPLVTRHRNARGIDHITLDGAGEQRPKDPESVLPSPIADDHAHMGGQCPPQLVLLDQLQNALQPDPSLWRTDCVHRGSLPETVVKRHLPLRGR
jgi:hypothetical protein